MISSPDQAIAPAFASSRNHMQAFALVEMVHADLPTHTKGGFGLVCGIGVLHHPTYRVPGFTSALRITRPSGHFPLLDVGASPKTSRPKARVRAVDAPLSVDAPRWLVALQDELPAERRY